MAQSSSYVPTFLSQFLTRALMVATPQVEKELCDYFVSFTERLISAANDGKLAPKNKTPAKDTIMEIWKSVSSTLAENIQVGIDKAIVRRLNEESKAKQKLETMKLPTCGRRSGPKTKNPNKLCGKPCPDKTVYKDKDGNEYCLCKKHTKAASSKHSCEWTYGDEAPKKKATKCGCRVKSETVFATAGSWKGVTYAGLWICDKHTKKANENLEKNTHKCKFSGGKKECDKLQKHVKDDKTGAFTWLSDMCAKHSKKSDKKQNQKDSDQRKKLKSGGKDKKNEKSGKDSKDAKSKKAEKEEKKAQEEKEEEESEDEGSDNESEDESDNEEESPKTEKKDDSKASEKKQESAKPVAEKSGSHRSSQTDEKTEKTEKKTEAEKPKAAAEKIIAKDNFSVKGNRKPDWKHKMIKDGDDGDMSIFIDITSGLVVYDEEDMESETLEEDKTEGLIAYGVWNNKGQEVEELSKPAKKYAEKLGITK